MSEQGDLGQKGIIEFTKPSGRFVQLSKEEYMGIFGYMTMRMFSPIVGMRTPNPGEENIVNVSGHPLGLALYRFSRVIEGESDVPDLCLVRLEQDDIDVLDKDIANQEGLGNPEILERVRGAFLSLQKKWDGAIG